MGNLLIRKIVDLSKNNDLTPEIGEFLKCPVEQLTQFRTFDTCVCTKTARGAFDDLVQNIFSPSPNRDSPVFPPINRYPIQPRIELTLPSESPDRGMCLNADILQKIIRNVSITGQSIESGVNPVSIP